MSELVCGWCGVGSPAGSAACQACGASFETKSEKPQEQQTPQEPAAQPEPVEELTQPELPAKAAAEPAAQPPVSSAPAPSPVATELEAAPAPSGDTPSIADLIPCPSPGCFGVVAPGDAFCTFCGGRLPAAGSPAQPPPAPPADLPPLEPLLPLSPAGPQPPGSGFHIPRAVWVVLAIIPLALCAIIAAVVLNAIGAPPGVVDPSALPEVQKEAGRIAESMVTPTATRTTTATPTATATPGAGVKQPTASTHATYTPLPVVTPIPALPAGASTVSLQGNLYTGVKVYMKSTGEYLFTLLGKAMDCPVASGYPNGVGYKSRLPNAREQWGPEASMLSYASSGAWVVRADDPALQTKQLAVLTGCQ